MHFVEIIIEYLPIFMFLTMGVLLIHRISCWALFLGGVAITYGFIGYLFGVFRFAEFFNFVPRMWGFSAENLILVAIPSFVFMGTMMERSGIANDLLRTTQIMLRKVPGGLSYVSYCNGNCFGCNDRNYRCIGNYDDSFSLTSNDKSKNTAMLWQLALLRLQEL